MRKNNKTKTVEAKQPEPVVVTEPVVEAKQPEPVVEAKQPEPVVEAKQPEPKAILRMIRNVKHDGVMYRTNDVCPANLEGVFIGKGFVR